MEKQIKLKNHIIDVYPTELTITDKDKDIIIVYKDDVASLIKSLAKIIDKNMENKLPEKLIAIYSAKGYNIYEYENYVSIYFTEEDNRIMVAKSNISELINILTQIIDKKD